MNFFYIPAANGKTNQMIDSIVEDEQGRQVGEFSRLNIDQLREKYPRIAVGDSRALALENEKILTTAPEQTTEEAFWDALECLPPLDHCHTGTTESFKICERLSGRITSVFARVGASYWTFNDLDTISHQAILARVRLVMEKTAVESTVAATA